MVENGTARLELTKWDPEVRWTKVTRQGDLSKPQMSALREEALVWRHGFEKELAREKLVRGRMQERRAISDSIEQVLQFLFKCYNKISVVFCQSAGFLAKFLPPF